MPQSAKDTSIPVSASALANVYVPATIVGDSSLIMPVSVGVLPSTNVAVVLPSYTLSAISCVVAHVSVILPTAAVAVDVAVAA